MVSTATKIGSFDFDNCLMNAAGVYCMTREELAEIEDSAAGSFVTKQERSLHDQAILNHVTLILHLVQLILWAYQTMAINIILIMSQNSKITQKAKITSCHLLVCQKKKLILF